MNTVILSLVEAIKAGRITIDDVPEGMREDVQENINTSKE
jgi:hypothetical protein